jgi:hypothetical protein
VFDKSNLKKETLSIWEEQIDDLLKEKSIDEMSEFLSLLTIIMNDKYDERLVALYKLVGNIDTFSSIINDFSGLTITIPTKEDFTDTLQVALSYYYKEVKGMSWKEIQKELPYENNIALKASKGIIKIKKELRLQLQNILEGANNE